MGELGALFNPGMRHELEERRSKAARREEEGNARDADLRIDLESGVAVINIPGDEDDAVPGIGSTDTASGGTSSGETASGETASVDTPSRETASGATESDANAATGRDTGVGGNTEGGSRDASAAGQEPEQPATTPLRPRGKRGMSTSTR
jgi:hypothetical protein